MILVERNAPIGSRRCYDFRIDLGKVVKVKKRKREEKRKRNRKEKRERERKGEKEGRARVCGSSTVRR